MLHEPCILLIPLTIQPGSQRAQMPHTGDTSWRAWLWAILLISVVPNHVTPERTRSTTSLPSAAKPKAGPSQAAQAAYRQE
jgi:hypothetical protein